MDETTALNSFNIFQLMSVPIRRSIKELSKNVPIVLKSHLRDPNKPSIPEQERIIQYQTILNTASKHLESSAADQARSVLLLHNYSNPYREMIQTFHADFEKKDLKEFKETANTLLQDITNEIKAHIDRVTENELSLVKNLLSEWSLFFEVSEWYGADELFKPQPRPEDVEDAVKTLSFI